MKKVLIISFYFPPFGGTSVMRIAKFCKYLPACDWQPVVLTIEDQHARRRDFSLLQEVSDTSIIHRTRFDANPPSVRLLTALAMRPSLQRFSWRLLQLRRLMFFPDECTRWWFKASAWTFKLVERNKIDAIFSSGDPLVNHMAACLVSRLKNIPWIADFRDEWAVNPEMVRSKFQKQMCEKAEQAIFKQAGLITSVTQPVVDMLIGKAPRLRKKFRLIPNGYDADEVSTVPETPTDPNRFVITYTGNLTTYANFAPLLKAVKMLISLNLIPMDRILVQLVGDCEHYKYGDWLGLADVVKRIPHRSHPETLALQKNSALLLATVTGPRGKYAFAVKLYEYMASGRPILALVPEDSVMAEAVRQSNTGRVVNPDRIEDLAGTIHDYYLLWRQNRCHTEPNRTFLEQFDRRKLAGRLADLLNELQRSAR
jgi:glycosyltransferase involved in cell wall biosynthesis